MRLCSLLLRSSEAFCPSVTTFLCEFFLNKLRLPCKQKNFKKKQKNLFITSAFIFSDSKIAIAATVTKKPKANAVLSKAISAMFTKLSMLLKVQLLWIRGHSCIGGNERVDRISKRFAKIDSNSARLPFDTALGAHISVIDWPFGFNFPILPEHYFLLRLPIPPSEAFSAVSPPAQRDFIVVKSGPGKRVKAAAVRPQAFFSLGHTGISPRIELVDDDLKHDRPLVGEVDFFIDPTNTHLIATKKRSRFSLGAGGSPLGKRHTQFSSGTHCEAELTDDSSSMLSEHLLMDSTSKRVPASKKRARSLVFDRTNVPVRRSVRIATSHSTAAACLGGALSQSFEQFSTQVSTVNCGMTGNSGGDSVNNIAYNNSANSAAASNGTTATSHAEISFSPSRPQTPNFLPSSVVIDTHPLYVSTASCGMTLINSQGDSVNNLSQTNSAAASYATASTGHAEIFQNSLKPIDDSDA